MHIFNWLLKFKTSFIWFWETFTINDILDFFVDFKCKLIVLIVFSYSFVKIYKKFKRLKFLFLFLKITFFILSILHGIVNLGWAVSSNSLRKEFWITVNGRPNELRAKANLSSISVWKFLFWHLNDDCNGVWYCEEEIDELRDTLRLEFSFELTVNK